MILIEMLIIGTNMPFVEFIVKVKMPAAQIVTILISLLLNMMERKQHCPICSGI